MMWKLLVLLMCLSVLVGCPDPEQVKREQEIRERESNRQSILSTLKQLEQQNELLSQRMIGREQKISSLQLQVTKVTGDLRAYDGEVKSFMMNHKTAIACMGALGVSLDKGNQYSKDAKDLATVAAVACGVGLLLGPEFRKEVFSVVDQLVQADSHAKDLQSQIKSLQSQLEIEENAASNEQSDTARLTSEIQNLQSQLSKL